MPTARRDNAAFTAVVSVLVGLGGFAMLIVLALSGAPSITFLATALAVLPVLPLVACYLWLDRYEPEPRSLLLMALAWGAFVATIAAILIGGIGGMFVGFTEETSLAVVAPVTEEASKGLFLLLLLWWRRAEFDGVLDGIVYAGMVGIGFAFTENILYLAAAYNGSDGMGPGGVAGITTTFVIRGLFSPFAHPLFTTFIGIGIGIAVSTRIPAVRFLAPLMGFVMAVLAHGLWNGSTIYGVNGFIGVYLILMVPAFIGLICLAVWVRSRERTLLTLALQDAASRGLMPATDIGWLVDLQARRAARTHARQTGGVDGLRAMKDYQQAAIELGFLHHRLLRGTAPDDYRVRGQDFLLRIETSRPHVSFPGQVAPTR